MTLTVENLHVRFPTGSAPVRAVNGASFEVGDGEIVGLVGESGCGKSVTARSIVRLEAPGEIARGTITFDGTDLTTAGKPTLRRLRNRELGIVFQHPSEALNPVYTVGEQIAEALCADRQPDDQPDSRSLVGALLSRARTRLDTEPTRHRVVELLAEVGMPQPADRVDAYPHQLSEGMCERVMLAIALARRPSVLVADEPTTALDTTTQAAILDRLATLNESFGMGMLLISHDLGVVSRICDRIVVMYEGTVVETGPTGAVLSDPVHPYTKSLLACRPGWTDPGNRLPTVGGRPSSETGGDGCAFADRCPAAVEHCRRSTPPVVSVSDAHTVRCGVSDARESPLRALSNRGEREDVPGDTTHARKSSDGGSTAPPVELDGVTKSFRTDDGLLARLRKTTDRLTAVSDVSLKLEAGETLTLVGESGCGKTTLARLIAGLETPDRGTVRLHGEPVGGVESRQPDQLEAVGVVFQNPATSLNPRRTVRAAIAEPLVEAGWSPSRRQDRIENLLELVDLRPDHAERYPRQLSGGQRQRVAIARALALEPSVLVLDEPTTALDVSVQARILNLLSDLQAELGVTYLFVTHDLEVARHVADRVAVMYLGALFETGPAEQVLSEPRHPYTGTLMSAAPGTEGATVGDLAGEPPDPTEQPAGCAYHDRCPIADETCETSRPPVVTVGDGRSRCHHVDAWFRYHSRTKTGTRTDTVANDDIRTDTASNDRVQKRQTND
ncbi:peptide/nickel transport system ATP-binding protein [Halalkaliarchaeum desulfuricum]|uniref:Peptide/nickel transport system ATP-binding protein n=1 Tax=Halalkaliarchaeum desulfuricum TaxID=2055893 RepID=A0A343TNC7_9EURY|nr:ABC transporter ATP-binding protein [Halalkaliarchaeum desulfuricum]AUX10599.1 peptide/nickel transport system ATP-binding protein [Halalkaliarchaeum desulfuricum]